MRMTLLQELKHKQGKQSDLTFSRKLGISRSLWNETRNGTKRIGCLLLQRVTKTFPDLDEAVLAFLKNGDE